MSDSQIKCLYEDLQLKQQLTLEEAAAHEDIINKLHEWVLMEQYSVAQLSNPDSEMGSLQEVQRQTDQVHVQSKKPSYRDQALQISTSLQADCEGISLETPKPTKLLEQRSQQRSLEAGCCVDSPPKTPLKSFDRRNRHRPVEAPDHPHLIQELEACVRPDEIPVQNELEQQQSSVTNNEQTHVHWQHDVAVRGVELLHKIQEQQPWEPRNERSGGIQAALANRGALHSALTQMAAALRVMKGAEENRQVGGGRATNRVYFLDERDTGETVAVPSRAHRVLESTKDVFSPIVGDPLDLRLEERLWELGPNTLKGRSISRLKSSTYRIGDMQVFLKLIDDQVTVYAGGKYHELGAWLLALPPVLTSPTISDNESGDDIRAKDDIDDNDDI